MMFMVREKHDAARIGTKKNHLFAQQQWDSKGFQGTSGIHASRKKTCWGALQETILGSLSLKPNTKSKGPCGD